jgi:hypothetical protein
VNNESAFLEAVHLVAGKWGQEDMGDTYFRASIFLPDFVRLPIC